MIWFGNEIQYIRTPKSTATPAASTWPAALAIAGRSMMSSITPTRQITAPAARMPSESRETTWWRPRKGIIDPSRKAIATPPNIATPPR